MTTPTLPGWYDDPVRLTQRRTPLGRPQLDTGTPQEDARTLHRLRIRSRHMLRRRIRSRHNFRRRIRNLSRSLCMCSPCNSRRRTRSRCMRSPRRHRRTPHRGRLSRP